MLLCPDDLSPCRRGGCGDGRCKRTGDVPMTACLECGVVVSKHMVVSVCVECVRRYAPEIEQGA